MMQTTVISEKSGESLPIHGGETFDLIEKSAIQNGYRDSLVPEAMRVPLSETDIVLIGIQPLDEAITNITEMFSMLPKITKKADRVQLKKAIQSRINKLEELYLQL